MSDWRNPSFIYMRLTPVQREAIRSGYARTISTARALEGWTLVESHRCEQKASGKWHHKLELTDLGRETQQWANENRDARVFVRTGMHSYALVRGGHANGKAEDV